MPCPWYVNGMCTSPKLSKPTATVVVKERCLGSEAEYRNCRYYVDPAESGQKPTGLQQHLKPASLRNLRPYPPIHLYHKRITSGCPFIKVYEYMGGWIAECLVLKRLLTKSEIDKCIEFWHSCPLYRMASKSETYT